MMTPTDISKYKINIDVLKKARNKLALSEKDEEMRRELEFLDAFIKDTDLVKTVSISNQKFQAAYKQDFCYIINEYFEYLNCVFEFYDAYDTDLELEPYEKIVTSYDEVFERVHDFYKGLDSEWFKLFMNIYKARYDSIQLTQDRSYSLLFPKSKIWIANIKTDLSIEDYMYATHEFGHGIADQISSSVKSYSAKNILLEMFPILCHLLFLDTSNIRHQNEVNKAIDNYRKAMLAYAEEVKFKYNIANTFGSYMNSPKSASKLIKRVFGEVLSNNEILSIYSNSVDENINYVYPYLIALELLELYRSDVDLFKYKVNTILTSDKDATSLMEELDIEPNRSLKL